MLKDVICKHPYAVPEPVFLTEVIAEFIDSFLVRQRRRWTQASWSWLKVRMFGNLFGFLGVKRELIVEDGRELVV
jgi:hypothetical protein